MAARTLLAHYPRLGRTVRRFRPSPAAAKPRAPEPTASTPEPRPLSPESSDLVTSRWNQLASEEFVRDLDRRSWIGIPEIHLNHNFRVTGDRNAYWVTWLRERFFPDGLAGDALSLGCGEGHVDRILCDCGFRFTSFTGVDVSPMAVDRARELSKERGGLAPSTTYLTADLNVHRLPTNAFDFIYFFQSLHHIERLEHILGECARALRPNGLLMVNEFVGPSRFQWSDRQKAMADALISLLPIDLRKDLVDGSVKTKALAPTVEDMILGILQRPFGRLKSNRR